METTVKMVGAKFVFELPLDQVLENLSKDDKLTITISRTEVVAAAKAAAPKPPVPGATKPGPKPAVPPAPKV